MIAWNVGSFDDFSTVTEEKCVKKVSFVMRLSVGLSCGLFDLVVEFSSVISLGKKSH